MPRQERRRGEGTGRLSCDLDLDRRDLWHEIGVCSLLLLLRQQEVLELRGVGVHRDEGERSYDVG